MERMIDFSDKKEAMYKVGNLFSISSHNTYFIEYKCPGLSAQVSSFIIHTCPFLIIWINFTDISHPDPYLKHWTHFPQVLRFKGYFTEQVEGGRQVCRIRPVVIYYYLVDDAIAVTEPRTPVSFIYNDLITNVYHPVTYMYQSLLVTVTVLLLVLVLRGTPQNGTM